MNTIAPHCPETVPCARCGGTGRRELRRTLQFTYEALRQIEEGTALDVSHQLGWRGNRATINNRLTRLHKAGLIARSYSPAGFYIWSIK